jgi:hypothetical protein
VAPGGRAAVTYAELHGDYSTGHTTGQAVDYAP